MNAQPKRQPAVINPNLVVGDLEFTTHLDRGRYLGTSIRDQPRWLEEHPGSWRRIEGDQREAASPAPPSESEIEVGAAPAGPNSQMSSRDDCDDEDDAGLVDIVARDHSPPREPASPSTHLPEPVANETTEAELPNRAKAGMSEGTGPKTKTTPPAAMRRKSGLSGGRKLKKQKLPAEVSKAGRKLSPERMRIVIENLKEYPILDHAASKAGIHRKTLEYWIKCSKAGNDGYDIEMSEGEIWRFHEHCEAAMDEADDILIGVVWNLAMGGVVYKIDQSLVDRGYQGTDAYLRDEDGTPVVETVRNPNGKMLRWLLERRRPEKYGKPRKIDVPCTGGVLVIGDVTKKPKNSTATAASIRV